MAKNNSMDLMMDLDVMDLDFDDEMEFEDFEEFDVESEDDDMVETFEEFEEPEAEPVVEPEPAPKPVKRPTVKSAAETPVNKPQPKTKTVKTVKVAEPSPAQPKAPKAESKKGMVRKTVARSNESYEDLFKQVTGKVDKYKEVMEARANGGKAIPQAVVISKELMSSLLAARFTEEQEAGLKLAMRKAMVSMGFDKEDVASALDGYQIKKVEADAIYSLVLQVMYEILNAEAGVPLFKTEDCNCSLKGKWTEASVKDNAHLQTEYATYTKPFLKVTASSPAPAGKKFLGHIKGGKFVPVKKDK